MTVAAPVLNQTARVLLIASDSWQSQCVELLLSEGGLEFQRVEPMADVEKQAASGNFDLAVLHLASDKSSSELLTAMRRVAPRLPLLLWRSVEEKEQAARAVEQSADTYLLEDQLGAASWSAHCAMPGSVVGCNAQQEEAEREFEKLFAQGTAREPTLGIAMERRRRLARRRGPRSPHPLDHGAGILLDHSRRIGRTRRRRSTSVHGRHLRPSGQARRDTRQLRR